MEAAGVVVSALCALAIVGMAPLVARAERRHAKHARLCSASLIVATLALVAALVATTLGAGRFDTGRFLLGMGAGIAVGLALSCAVLLLLDRR